MKEIFVALLLLAASICSAKSNALEREKLISAAIQDMEKELSTAAQYNVGPNGATTSSELLHAFKRASQQAVKQGKARLKFEKLIHKAERSILENERKEKADMSNLAKAEEIAKVLMSKPGSVLTKDEVAMVYQEAECPEEPKFDCNLPEMKTMRSVTGVCNNLEEPLLGSSGTAFRRLIEPQYEDGISQLRGTMQSEENSLFNGGPFQPPNPSPRIISLSVIQDQPIFNDDKTHLLMQWGQFMDHDLDLAPAFREPCEGCEITEQCVPIRVPTSDPIFGMPGPNQESLCNPFPRSIPACDPEAANGEVRPRQQINELTSFIDASQVYGSRQNVFDAVRDLSTDAGLLRTGPKIPKNGGVSLPIDTDDLVECMGDQACFLAGDVRVNEHLSLIVMHTLWLREHNRIAFELLQNSPGTSSEMIFQTARAIVGAEIQKITFKDYLPLLLGSAMSVIKPYTGYKADVDPTVPNAFAAAAFRFGHSQINPFFDRLDENNMPLSIGPLNLLDAFFNPNQYTISNGTDPILRGLLQRPARSVDEFVNDILTNHLFQTNASLGMDLAALNIQRGRDHGLPPYLTWKRWAQRECGISSEFINDLTEVRLLQTYGTLETVDLWVGGLSEQHVSGGLLGATFACIFAKTFEALRDGDRFYYENPESALFNAEQREALEDASLSRIICDNSDNIKTIQENAFRADQPSISCSSIKRVALENWNENECYLRAKVTEQMGEVELKSVSRLRGQKRELNEATLGIGVTTTCLRIVCPVENKAVRVGVYVNNNRRCMAKPSTLLKTRRRRRTLTGTISLSDIEDSNNGAYKSLSDCNSGNQDPEIIFACLPHVAAVESNEELLQDLETSLTQTASSQSTSIPDEILEYMKDEFEDDEPAESVHSEQSNVAWKEKTINTLENLLTTLKAEQNNNKADKNDEAATDQELYKNLAKLLKND